MGKEVLTAAPAHPRKEDRQMQNVTAAPDSRAVELANEMCTLFGISFGNRQWTHVADLDRAATLRLAYAAQLVRDAARRAAAFALRPCCYCGQAFEGERTDVGGEPMCADCVADFGATHAPAEYAPAALLPCGRLATDLRPAPVLPAWDELDSSDALRVALAARRAA